MRIGLKLWSTNKQYIDLAQELYEQKFYDFIELYLVPGSLEEYRGYWKKLSIPYTIHATHVGIDAINFCRADLAEENKKAFEQVQRFADYLDAYSIVLHPGIGGTKEELFKQISAVKDSRIFIENMPKITVKPEGYTCYGYSVEQIRELIEEFNFYFCLDIGHAFCAAHSLGIDPYDYVEKFLQLKPTLFHCSDVEQNDERDRHLNLGSGAIDFQRVFSSVDPSRAKIVLETKKNFQDSLSDFVDDVIALDKSFSL